MLPVRFLHSWIGCFQVSSFKFSSGLLFVPGDMVISFSNPLSARLCVPSAYRQEETVRFDGWDPSLNCIEQTTEWGACSQTCDMGVSTRVSNKNRRCEMVKQSRLCMIRPCDNQQEQTQLTQLTLKVLFGHKLDAIFFMWEFLLCSKAYKQIYLFKNHIE